MQPTEKREWFPHTQTASRGVKAVLVDCPWCSAALTLPANSWTKSDPKCACGAVLCGDGTSIRMGLGLKTG